MTIEAQIFRLTQRIEQLEKQSMPGRVVRGWVDAARVRGVSVPTMKAMVGDGRAPKPRNVETYMNGDKACTKPEWLECDLKP